MAARGENATKARIRETATRLFREKSFEVVTLNEICKASGVNKHTFYYYFKSKDELLERYYDLPWHLSASEVTNILNADSYVDQLWLIMQKFVDYTKRMGIQILRQVLIKNLNQDVGTFRPDNAMKEMCLNHILHLWINMNFYFGKPYIKFVTNNTSLKVTLR